MLMLLNFPCVSTQIRQHVVTGTIINRQFRYLFIALLGRIVAHLSHSTEYPIKECDKQVPKLSIDNYVLGTACCLNLCTLGKIDDMSTPC